MKRKNKILLLTLFLWSASPVNLAVAAAKDKVVYDKKTTIDFEGDAVDGQFQTPEGAAVKADQNLDFDSLIKPRKNFNTEMKRNSGAVR